MRWRWRYGGGGHCEGSDEIEYRGFVEDTRKKRGKEGGGGGVRRKWHCACQLDQASPRCDYMHHL